MKQIIFFVAVYLGMALSLVGTNAQYASSTCLTKQDTNQMVREKKVVSPTPLIKDAKSRYKGEVVNIQLCPESDSFLFFYVVILEPTGKVRFVAYDARKGTFYKVL